VVVLALLDKETTAVQVAVLVAVVKEQVAVAVALEQLGKI